MSFTNVVLTGTYFAPSGGAVQFQLDQTMMQPNGLIVAPTVHQVIIAIGSASTFSITLAATNDPATLPQGTAYQVTEQMTTAPPNIYWIVLPYNATGGTVDITECPRVVPTPYPIQSFVLASELGVAGGFATLDSTGNVPSSQLGNITSGGTGVDMPLAGGIFTGPTLYEYAGSGTTAINSVELSTDNFPRYVQLASAAVQITNPTAPANWGTHVSGNVGIGSDFQWRMESLSDTAHMMVLTFPQMHLTDGTHYLTLAASIPFPLTGSPNITVSSTTGLAASGTLTVQSVFFGTGSIHYTSVVNGTTLGGCTSSGLTTMTDTSQRTAIWVTDSYGAPIMWLGDYGGLYLNDQYHFSYAGVYTSASYDIIIGFANDVARNTGSAIYFGSDNFPAGVAINTASIGRGNDIYGNAQLLFQTYGSGGAAIFTLDIVGFYPSYGGMNLGTSINTWTGIYLSGTVNAGNGTAALPSYTFLSDHTSGFFNNPTAGISTIGISLGGNEVIQINPGVMYPIADNAYWFGAPLNRWAQIHSVQQFVANGSATVPSFTFDNDTETGFYSVSAGVIGVTSAGTAAGQFSSNGFNGNVVGAPQLTTINATTSGTFTAVANQIVNTTAATTVTLPASVSIGDAVLVTRGNHSGLITITANTGQTINNGASAGSVILTAAAAVPNDQAVWVIAQSATAWTAIESNTDLGNGPGFSGVAIMAGGSNTSGAATASTPTFANSATGTQLAQTTADAMVYFTVGTAGTVMVIKIGPTSAPSHTVFSSASVVGGQFIGGIRLPAGWYLSWTATTATMANQLAVIC